MEQIRVEDTHFDEAVVGVLTNIVVLDLDPYGQELVSIMHYTPEQARKLAAALTLAAEEAEKQ